MSAGFVLEAKGDSRLVSVKQLVVELKWSAAVDLDLMAFYRAKDGRTGGIFSDSYTGGSLGDLNEFPFMRLSGDEGGDVAEGSYEESLQIVKLDDIAELHIVAVNHTDASSGTDGTFSDYDGRVEVTTNVGEMIKVPLASSAQGSVACICKIVNTNATTGPLLSNESVVESFDSFKARVPGASGVQLSSNVVLRSTGGGSA
jgi:tellurite resistance protein TerA